MPPATNPLIASYASRHGLQEGMRADGRLTVVLDGNMRLHLCPAPRGQLALSAWLVDLPSAQAEREQLMQSVGQMAAGLLHEHPSTCVVDPDGASLWLQQTIAPDSDDLSVDQAIGQFANALAFWLGAVRRAA